MKITVPIFLLLTLAVFIGVTVSLSIIGYIGYQKFNESIQSSNSPLLNLIK